MLIRWALAATTIGSLIACASDPRVDVVAEREALGEAAESYHQAVNRGDVDAFAAAYAEGGTMMPPDRASFSGAEAFRNHARRFATLEDFTTEVELQRVVVSPDAQMGYTVARVVASWMENGEPMREVMRDVHIWTRDAEGEWKIMIDIWNSPNSVLQAD